MSLAPSLRGALALAALLVVSSSCDRPETAAAEETHRLPLVRVAPVELRQVRREITTTAYVESLHRVSVYSKVPGRVIEVPVDEGGLVRKASWWRVSTSARPPRS